MAMAALAEPQAIKISSKRQTPKITPAQWYRALDFHEYALATWTDDGILIQPLDVSDEDVTVDILRHLIAQGYEGDELIEQYKQMKAKIVSVKRAIEEAEEDVATGRVDSYDNMRARIRDRYGI